MNGATAKRHFGNMVTKCYLGIKKALRISSKCLIFMVELRGVEPLTS